MNRMRFHILLGLLLAAGSLFAESGKIRISEFMAINSKTLQDDDGDYPDWIELYNPGDSLVSLLGWHLTDDAGNLVKWTFPAITLPPEEYLIVFASGKDRSDPLRPLHTNFKLSGSGEFLALTEPGGTVISHSYGPLFPAQRNDVSYGWHMGQYLFFSRPTPGGDNVAGEVPFPPQFSMGRGFYTAPFAVTLSAPGNGTIFYTTDGTRPGKDNGIRYQDPVPVTTTSLLSAVTLDSAGVASEVITHTYLFTDGIIKQPNNPPGYPATWSPFKFSSGNAPADYEMDPQICNSAEYAGLMEASLKSIPSLSIVTHPGYLFSHEKDGETGGIYIYTGNTGAGGMGADWERPASVEFFSPQDQRQFQVNCGLRLHGGNSRVPENSPKHSFRLSFRSQYGPSKLNFRFFEDEDAAHKFNALVLRAGYNFSWVKNAPDQRINAQYLQDPFAKNTQRALGHPSAHQRFVHLYLNGLYWGIYNVSEKLTDDFMESYLNGEEDDFDVIKDHGGTVDGYWTAWSKLYNLAKNGLAGNVNYQKVQGRNPDGTLNPAYDNLLDIENLIDYMQYNFYIGNEDWDHNNWIAARNRVTNDAGFRFFAWDCETSMTSVNYNCVDENNEENPSWFYHLLRGNEDFRILFADHVQANFFNGGPLSPEAAAERYSALAAEIDLAIIAESARWGDYRKDTHPSDKTRILYTRNNHWIPKKNELLNTYFPFRSDIVVQQLREAGLFPSLPAPQFSHQGGDMTSAISLEMTANAGEIFYTTDGADPREQITSRVSAAAALYSGAFPIASDLVVKARAKSGNEWSPLTQATCHFANPALLTGKNTGDNLVCTIYPNPVRESAHLRIALPSAGILQMTIFTMEGRILETIYSGFLPEGIHHFDWTPGPGIRGVFLCRIYFGERDYSMKIIRLLTIAS
ncbi:MAG TPA: CotH kinase family protein [Prolixibacteraceae bacterium]|nr:CotH kinase family protein [Prolixibacteraceae bacterium]